MTDYKQEIEDLINSIINFKQASVDFAAEAELFSDNKTVLETANARLAQLKTEATQALAHLINKAKKEARIDELDNQLPSLLNYSLNQEQLNLIHDRIKELEK